TADIGICWEGSSMASESKRPRSRTWKAIEGSADSPASRQTRAGCFHPGEDDSRGELLPRERTPMIVAVVRQKYLGRQQQGHMREKSIRGGTGAGLHGRADGPGA